MPLTAKGNKILANMQREYGSKKGESVFYASRNKGTITGVEPGYASGGIVDHDNDPDLPRVQDDAELTPVMPQHERPQYPPEYLATIERLAQQQRQAQGLDRFIPGVDPAWMESYQRLHRPPPQVTEGRAPARRRDGGDTDMPPSFFYRSDRENPSWFDQSNPRKRRRRGRGPSEDGIEEVGDNAQWGARSRRPKYLQDGGGGGDGSGSGGGCSGCGEGGACGCTGDACGTGACGACSCGGSGCGPGSGACNASAGGCGAAAGGCSGCSGAGGAGGSSAGTAGGGGSFGGGGASGGWGAAGAAAAAAGDQGDTGGGRGGGQGGTGVGFGQGGPSGAGVGATAGEAAAGAAAAGTGLGVGEGAGGWGTGTGGVGNAGYGFGVGDAATAGSLGDTAGNAGWGTGTGGIGNTGAGLGVGDAEGLGTGLGVGGPAAGLAGSLGSLGDPTGALGAAMGMTGGGRGGGFAAAPGGSPGPGAGLGIASAGPGMAAANAAGIAAAAAQGYGIGSYAGAGVGFGGSFGQSGLGIGGGFATGAPGTGTFGAEADPGGGQTNGIGNAAGSWGGGWGNGMAGGGPSSAGVSVASGLGGGGGGGDDSGNDSGGSGGGNPTGGGTTGGGQTAGLGGVNSADLGIAADMATAALSGGYPGSNQQGGYSPSFGPAGGAVAGPSGMSGWAAGGQQGPGGGGWGTGAQGIGNQGAAAIGALGGTQGVSDTATSTAASGSADAGGTDDSGGGGSGGGGTDTAADEGAPAAASTTTAAAAADEPAATTDQTDETTGHGGGKGGGTSKGDTGPAVTGDISTNPAAPAQGGMTVTGDLAEAPTPGLAETPTPGALSPIGGGLSPTGGLSGGNVGYGNVGSFASPSTMGAAPQGLSPATLGSVVDNQTQDQQQDQPSVISNTYEVVGDKDIAPGGGQFGGRGATGGWDAPAAAGPGTDLGGAIESQGYDPTADVPADFDPTMAPPAVPALPSKDFAPDRTGSRGWGQTVASALGISPAAAQGLTEDAPTAAAGPTSGLAPGDAPMAGTIAGDPVAQSLAGAIESQGYQADQPADARSVANAVLGVTDQPQGLAPAAAAVGSWLGNTGTAHGASPTSGPQGLQGGPVSDPTLSQTTPAEPDPGFTPGSKGTVTSEPLGDIQGLAGPTTPGIGVTYDVDRSAKGDLALGPTTQSLTSIMGLDDPNVASDRAAAIQAALAGQKSAEPFAGPQDLTPTQTVADRFGSWGEQTSLGGNRGSTVTASPGWGQTTQGLAATDPAQGAIESQGYDPSTAAPATVAADRGPSPGLAAELAATPAATVADEPALAENQPGGRGDRGGGPAPGSYPGGLDVATQGPAVGGLLGGFPGNTTGLEGLATVGSYAPAYSPAAPAPGWDPGEQTQGVYGAQFGTVTPGKGDLQNTISTPAQSDRDQAIADAVANQNFTTGWEGMFGGIDPNAAPPAVTDFPAVDRTGKSDRDISQMPATVKGDLETKEQDLERAAPVTPVTKEPLPNIAPPPPFGGRYGGREALTDLLSGKDQTTPEETPPPNTTVVPQNVPPPPAIPDIVFDPNPIDPRNNTPMPTPNPLPASERTGRTGQPPAPPAPPAAQPAPPAVTDQPQPGLGRGVATTPSGLGGRTGAGMSVSEMGGEIGNQVRQDPAGAAQTASMFPGLVAGLQQQLGDAMLGDMFREIGVNRREQNPPPPDDSGTLKLEQPQPGFAGLGMAEGGFVDHPGYYAVGGLGPGSMRGYASTAHYSGANIKPAIKPAGVHLISSSVPGRTDRIPMKAAPGSFVLPADVVSGLGQGNTMAGAKMWGQAIAAKIGPMGVENAMRMRAVRAPTASLRMGSSKSRGFAEGGGMGDNGGPPMDDDLVPIVVAGGEALVDPIIVEAMGGGDPHRGKRELMNSVMTVRNHVIKHLKSLPRPVS